jgi:hypothetical protein
MWFMAVAFRIKQEYKFSTHGTMCAVVSACTQSLNCAPFRK